MPHCHLSQQKERDLLLHFLEDGSVKPAKRRGRASLSSEQLIKMRLCRAVRFHEHPPFVLGQIINRLPTPMPSLWNITTTIAQASIFQKSPNTRRAHDRSTKRPAHQAIRTHLS